jgi:RNA polymerase sigma factor (sigma-70 family)
MKTTISYYQQQKEYRLLVENTFQDLVTHKKADDKASFNKKLLKIIPEIRRYVNGRINVAIKKGHFPKGKHNPNEFIDQLFIEVYDHLDDIKKENDFYLWLFKKTNELLEDVIVEEEFDDLFFKNIDDYSKPEWDAMLENYSTDGDGDFVMIEDLDDRSYQKHDYTLNHAFIEDNEKELTEKLDKALSKEEINRHINMALHHLPIAMHTVFDLFTNQQFTLEEIAEIRNTRVQDVEKLLKEVKKNIKESFSNRYFK